MFNNSIQWLLDTKKINVSLLFRVWCLLLSFLFQFPSKERPQSCVSPYFCIHFNFCFCFKALPIQKWMNINTNFDNAFIYHVFIFHEKKTKTKKPFICRIKNKKSCVCVCKHLPMYTVCLCACKLSGSALIISPAVSLFLCSHRNPPRDKLPS